MTQLPRTNDLPNFLATDRPDLPEYDLGDWCCVPGCKELREFGNGHHVWRRSHKTVSWWVELEDGRLIPNRVPLCTKHHKDVTGGIGGHRARIDLKDGKLFWTPVGTSNGIVAGFIDVPYLKWYAGLPKDEIVDQIIEHTQEGAMQQTIDGDEVPHKHVVNEDGEIVECPRCHGEGKITKRNRVAGGELADEKAPRPKVVWGLRVPKDHRENGHEVLDTLVTACAEKLGRADHASFAYYTLIEVLSYFVQTYES